MVTKQKRAGSCNTDLLSPHRCDEMTALVLGIFWLHFCVVGGRGRRPYLFMLTLRLRIWRQFGGGGLIPACLRTFTLYSNLHSRPRLLHADISSRADLLAHIIKTASVTRCSAATCGHINPDGNVTYGTPGRDTEAENKTSSP